MEINEMNLEELETRSAVRIFLYLVEENQCIVFDELEVWVYQANLHYDFTGTKSVCKYLLVFGISYEVNLNERLVGLSELPYRISFSHLPCTAHNQRHSVGIVFPVEQIFVYFAFHHSVSHFMDIFNRKFTHFMNICKFF